MAQPSLGMSAPKSLLLLPSLPTLSATHTTYTPTLASLLPKLVPGTTKDISRLDIGLTLDSLSSLDTSQPRSALFAPLEALLRQAYSLVCLVAAQHGVDLDLPGGLDVRIFFVHTPSSETETEAPPPPTPLSGPLIDLATLTPSLSRETPVYVPGSEAGLELVKTFSTAFDEAHGTKPNLTTLSHGPSPAQESTNSITLDQESTEAAATTATTTPSIHKAIAVGGTFDHLHIGHKLLLTATLLPASPSPAQPPRTITVGVTDQELLVNKKYASVLEPWSKRVERTAEFVESILCFAPAADVPKIRRIEQVHPPHPQQESGGVSRPPPPNSRITRYIYTPLPPTTRAALSRQFAHDQSSVIINYTLITDPFGPTITEPDITGIVVSAETRAGGKAVNDKRVKKGWKALEVWEVGVLDGGTSTSSANAPATATHSAPAAAAAAAAAAPSFADKISSTEIRRRLVEMAKDGKL